MQKNQLTQLETRKRRRRIWWVVLAVVVIVIFYLVLNRPMYAEFRVDHNNYSQEEMAKRTFLGGHQTSFEMPTLQVQDSAGTTLWHINLPTPNEDGWEARAYLAYAQAGWCTWHLSRNGHVLAAVLADGPNAVRVLAWRDGVQLWNLQIPCVPRQMSIAPLIQGGGNDMRNFVEAYATDASDVYLAFFNFGAPIPFYHLRDGCVIANGTVKLPAKFWVERVSGAFAVGHRIAFFAQCDGEDSLAMVMRLRESHGVISCARMQDITPLLNGGASAQSPGLKIVQKYVLDPLYIETRLQYKNEQLSMWIW